MLCTTHKRIHHAHSSRACITRRHHAQVCVLVTAA
jgi:hypothetical protein